MEDVENLDLRLVVGRGIPFVVGMMSDKLNEIIDAVNGIIKEISER